MILNVKESITSVVHITHKVHYVDSITDGYVFLHPVGRIGEVSRKDMIAEEIIEMIAAFMSAES